MNKIIRITLASIALSVPTLASAGSSQEANSSGTPSVRNAEAPSSNSVTSLSAIADEKQRVLDIVRKYTRSVNEGDVRPEIIDELWEHSPDVSNINIRGHQKGFEEIKSGFYAPLFDVLTDRNLRMVTDEREPAIYIFDNTAIVEFYWKIDAKLKEGGKPISGAGRETHVLRKTDNRWKLVHLHYSGMPVKGF
ncbi:MULTISPECIES: YybH family protein [Rhizobium/Agrobacterium group]|uniref:YybH family protein n=1 Tax=Rhizobium/Agrobacterium group TaxID=227290 RepID=UPI0023017C95|nr:MULTISPECIES: nuclear transport factor 2 family protein [Rhizobium/Agrobacterium group]MDA5635009.1 nuclear transport factor 2 family protein [Agrobacterium sp. ST15.16.024]MDF1890157.1 nuclear transport factor 2 family protein [Rhizobium rhizogenes]